MHYFSQCIISSSENTTLLPSLHNCASPAQSRKLTWYFRRQRFSAVVNINNTNSENMSHCNFPSNQPFLCCILPLPICENSTFFGWQDIALFLFFFFFLELFSVQMSEGWARALCLTSFAINVEMSYELRDTASLQLCNTGIKSHGCGLGGISIYGPIHPAVCGARWRFQKWWHNLLQDAASSFIV